MDWNPLLNDVIRDRNAMAVKDPLVDLLAAMCKSLTALERSSALLPTMARATTAAPSDAPDDPTQALIPLLLRLLGDLTGAELTAVENDSESRDLLERFMSRSRTLALGVLGTISTSASPASPSSAAPEPDAAPSSSSVCSSERLSLDGKTLLRCEKPAGHNTAHWAQDQAWV